MSYDGATYVTGQMSKYVRGSTYDCLVMRLDYKLDIVYIKTFGDSNDFSEECLSI